MSQPTVPIAVVVDESGGIGNYSTLMARQIRDMQDVGITVLGYDPTWWAGRNTTAVKEAMQTWQSWYAVNGIYLDQMPNWNYIGPDGQWHYAGANGEYVPGYFASLTAYAKSLGMTTVVANAGADVPADFIGSVDTIGVFENAYLPSLNLSGGWTSVAGLGAWHLDYDKSNFMFFSYGISWLDPQFVLTAAKYYGYMYITNTTESAGYSKLTPYLAPLVSLLASTAPADIRQSPPSLRVPPSSAQPVNSPLASSLALVTPLSPTVIAPSFVAVPMIRNWSGHSPSRLRFR